MTRILFGMIFGMCTISFSNAQDYSLEQIMKRYSHIESDSVRNLVFNELANKHLTLHVDSAEIYARLIEANGQTMDSLVWYPYVNRIYSEINFIAGNFDQAMLYDYKTISFLEELHGSQPTDEIINLIALAYGDLCFNYFTLNKHDKALTYGLKSKELYNQLYEKKSKHYDITTHAYVLFNMGGLYLRREDYLPAQDIFQKTLELISTINDSTIIGTLYNNLGIVHNHLGSDDIALEYFMKARSIQTKTRDLYYLVKTYNNLGRYYFLKPEADSAFKYFNLALDISTQIKSWHSAEISCDYLIMVFEDAGEYKSALKYQKLYQSISDSLLNEENIMHISDMESKYKYQKIQEELKMKQEVAIAKKEKQINKITFLAGIALLSLVIITLLAVLQRKKIQNTKLKQKHLELERENLNLENQRMETELESKNKEATSNVLYLLKKNEFITDIALKLQHLLPNLGKEAQTLVYRIIRELQNNTDDSTWREFEIRFQEVHQSFYDNLNKHTSNLSPNERKLCAFLRLNMTTKDISGITFQSEKSIIIARSRLRKKLGLERDENLITFLSQF